MNILIPDSWIREYLKTKATPQHIAEYLSLCSQSVEKSTKVANDWVYEIEVTTNRPDCLSVYGIARELAVILPKFGLPAKLKPLPVISYQLSVKNCLPLQVKINNPSLCPRFTALIFDNIVIKPSPKVVRERVEKSGIRALNNVIDISNYLMLELGQPMHTFDYDKIKKAKMILRESAGGEKLVTLDGQTRLLPAGTIIIEDGEGRIVDLCGIMGGENSAVDENTKRVLLFVQTYDPTKIRLACQKMGFRTEAASRFEKGLDPEGVMTAITRATAMFAQNCGAKPASRLMDIYPHPLQSKTVKLDLNLATKIIGVEIPKKEIINTLGSLGFSVISSRPALPRGRSSVISFSVPHWRDGDVAIPEDLIEEIARIHGYYNLPAILPEGQIPQQPENFLFVWQKRLKEALKHWGFTETANYAMNSQDLLQKVGVNPDDCLKIANPLNEDGVFMRPTLIHSLLEVITKNQAPTAKIKIFELANIYLPKAKDALPDEMPVLCGAIFGQQSRFFQAKGITEALLEEMGIGNSRFVPYLLKKTFYGKVFSAGRTAEIAVGDNLLGVVGEISPAVLTKFGITGKVAVFDLDFQELVKHVAGVKKYRSIPKYPAVIEDLSFVFPARILVDEVLQSIKSVSPIVWSVELIDIFKETRTVRITYQNLRKTLTDKEVEEIRQKIIGKIKDKFGARLKTKS